MKTKQFLSDMGIFLGIITMMACVLFCPMLAWSLFHEPGLPPYPTGIGSFRTIGSATIDPMTLLEDIQSGKEPTLVNLKDDFPDEPLFIMQVGWSQNDYLGIVSAFQKVIWEDDPNGWYLYKAEFESDCEHHSGMFENADLYYYQEVDVNGEKEYSVRSINIRPEYGYIFWGGDTTYPRPRKGWDKIDLQAISNIPVEKALELAEKRGGSKIRKNNNYVCSIYVKMWPWAFGRRDWRVEYYGGIDNGRFWILTK
jgi:hypothetical protein